MGNRLNHSFIVADNIISSLGFTTQENIASIQKKQSGIQLDTSRKIADFPLSAAQIDQDRLMRLVSDHGLTNYNRVEQLVILSIQTMLQQFPVDLKSKRTGLILSSTKGNIDLLSPIGNTLPEEVHVWKTAQAIGNYFSMVNRPLVVSNACISGISALLVAHRLIGDKSYDQVIVAGVDVLSHFITSGFQSFHSLSEVACKPYDIARDGLSLGEACGTVLLSANKTANAIVIRGGAISNDANHISGPSRDGSGLYNAMAGAMKNAGVQNAEIDFVNLHGTATVYNDEMESKAMQLAGLQNVPANSLKPYLGHTLGASGVIESIICMSQLRDHTVYGTTGYTESGTTVPLHISADHQSIERANTCLKTASGFGGCNAAIVLSVKEGEPNVKRETIQIKEIKSCTIEKGTVVVNNTLRFKQTSMGFFPFIRAAYKELNLANPKFYKMDDLCKLGFIAASYLLHEEEISPDQTGIILANAVSSLDTDRKHQETIEENGDLGASPSCFVYTLPNIVAGEICIQYKLRSENTFFISEDYNESELSYYAQLAMNENDMDYCICGWCDLLVETYKADFKLYRKNR